jgi:multidrug efflux system outer membrane protein
MSRATDPAVPRRALRLAALLAAPALLAGCMLGPDYVRPPAVAEDAVKARRLHRADAAQVVAAPPPSRWWQTLDDPQLGWLIERALADSPDLRAAEARVRSARALVRQRHAEGLPEVNATGAYAHMQASESLRDGVREGTGQARDAAGRLIGPDAASAVEQAGAGLDVNQDLYFAGFDASWELDLFGRRRRAAEQASAQADAAQAELADAQVQLAAEVGQAYLNFRGTQERLRIARDNLDKAQQSLQLTRQRRGRGAESELEVERSLSQVQQQEAQLPQLQARLDEGLDQLALMLGRPPGALDAQLTPVRPLPQLPAVVPVDDPAALIRRRPDVRQAERQLVAANAQIGQALAGYFPQVTLMGSVGAAATSASDLDADAVSTLVAPVLRWSVFDFGRVSAQVEQARAGTDASAASYQGAVLAALQDANTALARFGASRRQVLVADRAQASATRSAALTGQRYAAGTASLIDALDVQRQQLSAQDQAAQARTQLLVDYVALQKSLGLGWQDAPVPGAAAAQQDSVVR